MKTQLTALTQLKKLPVWLGLALTAGLFYLAVAQFGAGFNGFPLDDAWIHQTYARNLGQLGQFAFTPNVSSAGSTSPLWTILLSLGYALNIPFKLWAYGWGIAFLGLSGFSMARLGQYLFAEKPWLGPLVGLAVIFEWHLVWAAVSGMETILFVWLSIFLLEQYLKLYKNQTADEGRQTDKAVSTVYRPSSFVILGLLGGLLALVRPEGLLLIGLIGLHWLITQFRKSKDIPRLLSQLFPLGLGVLIPLLPYIWFNYSVSGSVLPNTAYAKQQEYANVSQQLNLLQRWVSLFAVTLIGFQILLVPGFVKAGIDTIRQKNWLTALIFAWQLSFISLYAIRLPVTYQHGRYLIPTIPWLLLLGIWGTALLLRVNHKTLWIRVLSRAALPTLILAGLMFVWLGAQGYANDVEFIETEMVKTALWLNNNTPVDSIIAAHDIGAIGYFSQRPLVDLAGLITPAVIPFITNETALLEFAQNQGAAYLVTFPNWYPFISQTLADSEVYSTNSPWAIEAGYDNMKVYQLKAEDED